MTAFDLIKAARDARGLGPCEKAVLLCLATYASADGSGAWPSLATLTDDTAWSRSRVAEARSALVARGVIVRRGTTTSGTVCFDLSVEAIAALADAAPVAGTRPAKGGKVRPAEGVVRPTDGPSDGQGSAPRTGGVRQAEGVVRPTDGGGPPDGPEQPVELPVTFQENSQEARAPTPEPKPPELLPADPAAPRPEGAKPSGPRGKAKRPPPLSEDVLGALAEVDPVAARSVADGGLTMVASLLVKLVQGIGEPRAVRRLRFIGRQPHHDRVVWWRKPGPVPEGGDADLAMVLRQSGNNTVTTLDVAAERLATTPQGAALLDAPTDPGGATRRGPRPASCSPRRGRGRSRDARRTRPPPSTSSADSRSPTMTTTSEPSRSQVTACLSALVFLDHHGLTMPAPWRAANGDENALGAVARAWAITLVDITPGEIERAARDYARRPAHNRVFAAGLPAADRALAWLLRDPMRDRCPVAHAFMRARPDARQLCGAPAPGAAGRCRTLSSSGTTPGPAEALIRRTLGGSSTGSVGPAEPRSALWPGAAPHHLDDVFLDASRPAGVEGCGGRDPLATRSPSST